MRKNEEQAKKLLKRFTNESFELDNPILNAMFGGKIFKGSITEFVIDEHFIADRFILDIINAILKTGCKVAYITFNNYNEIKSEDFEIFKIFEYDELMKKIEEICKKEKFDFVVIDTLLFFNLDINNKMKEIRTLMQTINRMSILYSTSFIFFNTISTIIRKKFVRDEPLGLTSTRFIPDMIILIEQYRTSSIEFEVKIKKSRFAQGSCFKIYYTAEKGINEIATYAELLTKLKTKYKNEEVFYIQKADTKSFTFFWDNNKYNCKSKKQLYLAINENFEEIKKAIPYEAFLCY